MLQLKKSTAVWVPVKFADSAGNPVGGLVYSIITCAVMKADGTEAVVTVTGTDWAEAVSGALLGSGNYRLLLPASVLNVSGPLVYAIQISTPPLRFSGLVNVVDNLEVDTYNRVGTLSDSMTRALGLMHENSVLDQTNFDSDNNLVSARYRFYDSKASAQLAGMTGLLGTYSILAVYVGGNLTNYSVVKEP